MTTSKTVGVARCVAQVAFHGGGRTHPLDAGQNPVEIAQHLPEFSPIGPKVVGVDQSRAKFTTFGANSVEIGQGSPEFGPMLPESGPTSAKVGLNEQAWNNSGPLSVDLGSNSKLSAKSGAESTKLGLISARVVPNSARNQSQLGRRPSFAEIGQNWPEFNRVRASHRLRRNASARRGMSTLKPRSRTVPLERVASALQRNSDSKIDDRADLRLRGPRVWILCCGRRAMVVEVVAPRLRSLARAMSRLAAGHCRGSRRVRRVAARVRSPLPIPCSCPSVSVVRHPCASFRPCCSSSLRVSRRS